MSHFTVLVVGENVEELLQPYHEYECTDVDDEYVEIVEITDSVREDYQTSKCSCYKNKESGKIYGAFDEMFYREPTIDEKNKIEESDSFSTIRTCEGISFWRKDWNNTGYDTVRVHYLPEGYEEIWATYEQRMSFEDYLKHEEEFSEFSELNQLHYMGYIKDKETSQIKVYDKTNPNSKWDWWVIGGRWSNKLKTLNNTQGNQFYKKEINYAKSFTDEEWPTFAVVFNGEWIQKGEMGWWGITTDAKEQEKWNQEFKKIWDSIDENELITLVDCHI